MTLMKGGLASLLLAALGAVAHGAEPPARVVFNIEAQPIRAALKEFGKQTGLQLLVRVEGVPTEGITAPAVTGSLTPEDALGLLLARSGLKYEFVNERTVRIAPARAPREPTSSAREIVGMALAQNTGVSQAGTTGTEGAPGTQAQDTRNDADVSRASAQTPEAVELKGVPEILVKGSKTLNMDIRRTREDAQPYVIFEREAIAQSGATNLENFLRERLPMNAAGLENSQRVTQMGSRSSFNLRGLGGTQTLILIDGRRTVNGPSFGGSAAQPDIMGIPMAAVERIEVLPATSSGIYGGNATGGVINIITRQEYSGMELTGVYGNTFDGDAPLQRFEATAGSELEDGRTNLMLAASYADTRPLALGNRRSLVDRYYSIARTNAPSTLFPPGNPPLGSTPNIRSANGANLVLDNGTALNSPVTFVPYGYTGTTDGGAALVANAGRFNFDLPDVHQFFTGARNPLGQRTKVKALRGTVQREFSDRWRVFLEGSYANTGTNGRSSTTNGSHLQPYQILAGAPTNPFNTDILVTLPTDSLSSVISTDTTTSRFVLGAITSLPGKWKAEADYTWARDRSASDIGSLFTTGDDIVGILTGAIPVLRDTTRFPVDLSATLAAPATITPQKATLNDVAVRFSGPLFNLPAGPVMLSSLLEYRHEKYNETLQVVPSLFTVFYPDHSARTYSAYVESTLPLRKDLEWQLAVRFDKYRTFGKTGFVIEGFGMPIVSADNTTDSVNPTVALRYRPGEEVMLRASYGTGFVAPDASQLAPSQNLLFDPLIDPRRGNTAVSAAGVAVLQGGNPDLDPESSENLSFGAVFTPRLMPGLRISADYTRIEKTDNISFYPTGLQGLVNDEALLPGRIARGANLPGDQPGWAGPIRIINASLMNISRAEVEAVDLQLDYTWTTGAGEFAFTAVASRQLHFRTQGLPGQPTLENVGKGYDRPQAINGNAQLNWKRGAWQAGWSARHYDSYSAADPKLGDIAATLALQGNGGRVASQTYHDAYVGYRFDARAQGLASLLKDSEVNLALRNLFDELPPFDAGLFFLMHELYSPLGDALKRTYTLSISKRF